MYALPQGFDKDIFIVTRESIMPRIRDPILQNEKSVI